MENTLIFEKNSFKETHYSETERLQTSELISTEDYYTYTSGTL